VKAVVIDASVAIKWVIDEPFSGQAASLLAGWAMCAPAHWQAEAANALWAQVARGSWLAEEAVERLATLAEAPVEPVPLAKLLDRALDLAIALHSTVYDSLYVALAESRGIPLISDDRKLLRKMRANPVLAALAQHIGDLPLP
jgi:predicted nucleic acid-binding protein